MGTIEKASDVLLAVEQLKDEIQGIGAYKKIYEGAICPELKKIAEQHLAGEKQHALHLAAWIHKYIETA